MQGLVVVLLIVEKIWNINVNCVKVNGAQNIGQGNLSPSLTLKTGVKVTKIKSVLMHVPKI